MYFLCLRFITCLYKIPFVYKNEPLVSENALSVYIFQNQDKATIHLHYS